MLTAVRLVAVLGLLLQSQGSAELLEEDCGIGGDGGHPILRPKIISGENATNYANPWMASLLSPRMNGAPPEFFCAGTLIHEFFVLTAAHCVDGKRQIIVRLGEHDRSSEDKTTTENIYVVKAHIYPTYRAHDKINDIALLRLYRSVSYKLHIQPICIQLDPRKKSQLDTVMEFTAVGWGKTGRGVSSNVLQTATLNRLPNKKCDDQFWNNDNPSQFCAGTSSGQDTCDGDSGGPLYSTGRYAGVNRKTQLGIISFGSTECTGIGIYTDVISYAEWIKYTVLESDIVIVLPNVDLLDSNCLNNSTQTSRTSSFPWLAHVYIDSFILAVGTLISDSFVISTAQLYPEGVPLKVRLGKNSGSTEFIYKVESVLRHPNFASLSVNDIALLKLKTKVEFTDHIRPICLPQFTNEVELNNFQQKTDKAEHFVAIGYDRGTSEPVQRINSTNCYQGNYQGIDDKQLCVRHPHSTSLASGSPLVRRFAHGDATAYTLVGMASFGHSDRRGPDVYTKVLSYSKWISGLIKEEDELGIPKFLRNYRFPSIPIHN